MRGLPNLRWRPGRLAHHSSVLTAWMLVRAASQAATVILLARHLGASDYGQFVAILAFASFISPFVGLGLSNVLLRDGAKRPQHLPAYFADALRWWGITLLPAAMIACVLAALALQGIPKVPAYVAIAAEIAATSLTELRARHQQAMHRINAFGLLTAGLPLTRLGILASAISLFPGTHAPAILLVYAAASALYVVLLLAIARSARTVGRTEQRLPVRSGLTFSLSAFAIRVQAEFNKPVLASLGFGLTGAYNAGQRASDLASIPLLAIQESLWPRLYSHDDPKRQLRRSGMALLVLALGCALIVWAIAPLLPRLLGSDFSGAVGVMRSLAFIPLLQSFRSLLNYHMIHMNRMLPIGMAYGLGAIISIAGVTILVPSHGTAGAVLATYISELSMIGFLMFAMAIPGLLARRD